VALKELVNHLTHRYKDGRGVSIVEFMQLKDTCKNKSNTGMGVTEIDPRPPYSVYLSCVCVVGSQVVGGRPNLILCRISAALHWPNSDHGKATIVH
jgi:hypothetical protein